MTEQPSNPEEYFSTEHLQDDLEGRTARGGFVIGVAQVLKSLLDGTAFVLLARLLTPEIFGLVGMVTAITSFLENFKDLGLTMATVQREEMTHAEATNLFWINLGFGTLLTILVAISAPLIAWFYSRPELIMISLALAPGFLLNGLSVQHTAILKRRMRFTVKAIVEFSAVFGSVAIAIGLAWYGFGYWALVGQQVSQPFIVTAMVWFVCGWRPSLPQTETDVTELVKFGGNLSGFSLLNYFARNLDDVLIGRYIGSATLGLYRKAYEIFKVPIGAINSPLRTVIVPTLSRLLDQPDRYRKMYLRVVEKIQLVTIPLGILMIAGADWIILIVLGDQWLGATPILRALGVGTLVQPTSNTTGWLFVSQDRTDDMMQWGIVGSSLTALSFVCGLPWGAEGIALVYSVSGLLVRTPILFWFVGQEGPIRGFDVLKTAIPAIIAGTGTGAALVAFRMYWAISSPWLGLGIMIGMTLASTVIVLGIVPQGRRVLTDFWAVVKMIRRKKEQDDSE